MPPSLADALDLLAAAPVCGYRPDCAPATEPTALAGLALAARGRDDGATKALDWLAAHQNADGSLGITADEPTPAWPTSLALVAWGADPRYATHAARSLDWLLGARGAALPRTPEMGHDSTLVGWCWAEETHSWVEPTAWAVLALKAAGQGEHPRAREAVRLLVDRLLPGGGCNYGNTLVLGGLLRPHVQPTALALLALADESIADPRLAQSVDYLQRTVPGLKAAASLSYAVLALAKHRRPLEGAQTQLEAALARTLAGDRSGHKLALLALASAEVLR